MDATFPGSVPVLVAEFGPAWFDKVSLPVAGRWELDDL